MRALGMLRPTKALVLWQREVRVDFTFEATEKTFARFCRGFATIVGRVEAMRPNAPKKRRAFRIKRARRRGVRYQNSRPLPLENDSMWVLGRLSTVSNRAVSPQR